MIRQKLILLALALVLIVGGLHLLAIDLHLYWTVKYFDSLLHFLSGGAVGFAGIWFALTNKNTLTPKEILAYALWSIVIVGILWEIFELMGNITSFSDGMYYITDTTSDLVMDILGSLMAVIYTRQFIIKNNG